MLLISTSCMLPTSTFVPWLTWGAEQGMSSALRSATHHTCSHGKPHQPFRASVLTMMKWGQNSPLTKGLLNIQMGKWMSNPLASHHQCAY